MCYVVEYCYMKSEKDPRSELSKAILISTAKSKSGQADKIFSSLNKDMNSMKQKYPNTQLEDTFGHTFSKLTNINAK